ncbi:hypothetical protein [Amycolatopsis vancoresmycina]|uniref:hypothetical protein n=1 Tax=Amycolatopsis vancoresmycina TaxID=208444 RepID=UPI000524D436|nr:hypothetical protein [Amycolatopsis vancoresmycina]
MSNDVRIQVHWDDKDGDRFAKSTKDKAKRAGEQAGTEFEGTFKGKLGPAGEKAGQAAGDGLEKGLRDKSRRAGKSVEDEMGRVAKRSNNAFDAAKFTALSVGLPAAAGAGAAGAGVALAAVPLLFAGVGAAALKGNAQVEGSFMALKNRVVGDTQAMADVLAGPVSGAADQLGASFNRLRPQIQSAMAGSAPAVHELTGAVTDFAENAMPGMVTAVKSSEPALRGLHSFSSQAGKGLGDFFTNVSAGSEGAGQGLMILGGTVGKLEGRLGTLFANLANGSAGPLRSLDVVVDQVTGSLVDLTAQGSGAMGFLQGFTSAGSGLATVLRGVSSLVSTLPPGVTQFAGTLGATSMVASKFGLDAGAAFEGLGGKIKAAEGVGGKLKTTIMGLAEGGLNPATLAVGALGLGLSVLGHEQEVAARYAAEHAAGVQRLTAAIREDGGVLGEHTKQANIDALTTKNAAANLASFGRNMGDAKLAIEGNTDAYDRLNYSARARLDQIAKSVYLTDQDRNALKDFGSQALATGKNYDEMSQAGGRGAEVAAMLGDATKNGVAAVINANGAIGAQIQQQKAAYESYLQSEGALTGLAEAQIKARDATAEHTQSIYEQVNASLGLRGAQMNTKQALDDYNTALKSGKEDDKAAALFRLEQAWQAELSAVEKNTEAHSQAATPEGKHAEGMAAMNSRAVELANTFRGTLPASLAETIGRMSATEAKAAGVTVAIDGTGNAVYRLPNGKFVSISTDAGRAAAQIEYVQQQINALHSKTVRITVETAYGTSGKGASITGPYVARAKGGMVGYAGGGQIMSVPRFAGGGFRALDVTAGGLMQGAGTGTSDSLLAMSSAGLFRGSAGEFVVRASQTRKFRPLLEDLNNGVNGFAGSGMATGSAGFSSAWGPTSSAAPPAVPSGPASATTSKVEITLNITGGDRDMQEMIRKWVRVDGGGNVQVAFGR